MKFIEPSQGYTQIGSVPLLAIHRELHIDLGEFLDIQKSR